MVESDIPETMKYPAGLGVDWTQSQRAVGKFVADVYKQGAGDPLRATIGNDPNEFFSVLYHRLDGKPLSLYVPLSTSPRDSKSKTVTMPAAHLAEQLAATIARIDFNSGINRLEFEQQRAHLFRQLPYLAGPANAKIRFEESKTGDGILTGSVVLTDITLEPPRR